MSSDRMVSESWKRKPQKRATEAYPVAGARLGLVMSGFAAPRQISNLNLPTGVSGGQHLRLCRGIGIRRWQLRPNEQIFRRHVVFRKGTTT